MRFSCMIQVVCIGCLFALSSQVVYGRTRKKKKTTIQLVADHGAKKKTVRTPRRKNARKLVSNREQHGISQARNYQARLVDIPVPVGACLVHKEHTGITSPAPHSGDSFLLRYAIGMSQCDILDFYVHEMERLGWRKITLYQAQEVCAVFDKPDRSTVISLRPFGTARKKDEKMELTLFSGKKK